MCVPRPAVGTDVQCTYVRTPNAKTRGPADAHARVKASHSKSNRVLEQISDCTKCLNQDIPLNEMQSGLRLHDVTDVARLQCKSSIFKLLLHLSRPKETPTHAVSIAPLLLSQFLSGGQD